MSDIKIPPEVWRAAMSVYHKEIRRDPGNAWQAAIRAALAAWPGMATIKEADGVTVAVVYLPLPQEARDE